jgi:hypothetical protein
MHVQVGQQVTQAKRGVNVSGVQGGQDDAWGGRDRQCPL